MQAPLGSPTKLAGRLDRLGLYVLSLLLCTGWFYFLWGHVIPAALSGIALTVLLLHTLRLGEKKTLSRREDALRRRIGGEMAVDSLLLQSEESAVSNVMAWLAQAVRLHDGQIKPHGILARHESAGLVWVSCLRKHAESPAKCDDVLAHVRMARQEKADLLILCATASFTQEALLLGEELTPKTHLLGRGELIKLAGTVAPATDEQLRALGKRRRKKLGQELWRTRILDARKKRKYLIYGLGLCFLYLMTGQVMYVIPGLALLCLFALCHKKRTAKLAI